METIENRPFTGIVNVDGVRFVRCTFTDCMLVYAGNLPSAFHECVYSRTVVHFAGAAHLALEAAFKFDVEGLFDVVGMLAGYRKARKAEADVGGDVS